MVRVQKSLFRNNAFVMIPTVGIREQNEINLISNLTVFVIAVEDPPQFVSHFVSVS